VRVVFGTRVMTTRDVGGPV